MLGVPLLDARGVGLLEARFLDRLIVVESSPPITHAVDSGIWCRLCNLDAFFPDLVRVLITGEFGQEVAYAVDPEGTRCRFLRLLFNFWRSHRFFGILAPAVEVNNVNIDLSRFIIFDQQVVRRIARDVITAEEFLHFEQKAVVGEVFRTVIQ